MEHPQYATTSTQTNQLAIVSLISGVVAWGMFAVSCLLSVVGLGICTVPLFYIGSIVAVVTGHMARRQIAASGGTQSGDGMAMTGLVLGWIGVGLGVLSLVAIIVIVVLALLGPSIGNVFSNIVQNI